jgi:hypothetical protein
MRKVAINRTYVNLSDIQGRYRRARHAAARKDLRDYLIDGAEPSGNTFASVSSALFVSGQVDKHGLADAYLQGADVRERARLFSEISTSRLDRRRR